MYDSLPITEKEAGEMKKNHDAAFKAWAKDHYRNYLYSTLGYTTPERFETEYKTSRATQLNAT